ncbi:MAG: ABC transporter ATP-binding protein [Eubacteriales bacterium]|nr:ABC transporter ATP-binding protein [Eubacteriales bacterium]MDD3200077.1 ABC transporter ATP-binding protein [Eubacteriales bacterium]MDD4122208.1 ABC transporter ATP-binding protein [Eubacteriales bacterium]MDD4630361.1 ABC transporter ATP-binding protein [Eubacteriales bacterium]
MGNETDCITLNKINKFFGDKQVLKDVSFSIPYGCIFGLLGPSGCGKTTTVKIIAGISESTSGETFVLDEKMPQLSLMNEIGYMAQSDALYLMLSAADNLEFFAAVYGMKKIQYKKRILEVMELVNLGDDLNKPVYAYSGGMRRRLSLAMAILHNPKVLILDEPTVGIDPLLRQDIWKELYGMSENGVTILVTTHIMDEALKCHRLAMMRKGVLIAQGTPEELQNNIGAVSLEEAFIHYGGSDHED